MAPNPGESPLVLGQLQVLFFFFFFFKEEKRKGKEETKGIRTVTTYQCRMALGQFCCLFRGLWLRFRRQSALHPDAENPPGD
jgi:hypothetical protein